MAQNSMIAMVEQQRAMAVQQGDMLEQQRAMAVQQGDMMHMLKSQMALLERQQTKISDLESQIKMLGPGSVTVASSFANVSAESTQTVRAHVQACSTPTLAR